MQLSNFFLLTLAVAPIVVSADYPGCDINLGDGKKGPGTGFTLHGKCSWGPQQTITSSLDLNKCIVNNSGTTVWQKNGGFGSSCEWCRLVFTSVSQDLSCYCRARNGNLVNSYLNLRKGIARHNGKLVCA